MATIKGYFYLLSVTNYCTINNSNIINCYTASLIRYTASLIQIKYCVLVVVAGTTLGLLQTEITKIEGRGRTLNATEVGK